MSWSKSYFLRHTCSILCALEHESGMRSTYIVFERCLLLASQLVMGNNTMCVVKHHMYCTRECRRLRQKLLLWRDPSMADILIPSHRKPSGSVLHHFLVTRSGHPLYSWLQAYSIYIYIRIYNTHVENTHYKSKGWSIQPTFLPPGWSSLWPSWAQLLPTRREQRNLVAGLWVSSCYPKKQIEQPSLLCWNYCMNVTVCK